MPRKDPFASVFHDIGNFFHDPLGNIAKAVGGVVKDIGHTVGGVVHDVVGGVSSGINPTIKQIGDSTTQILAKGVSPVTKTATEGLAKDITSLGKPLEALSLPLMVGAGVVGLILVRQFLM